MAIVVDLATRIIDITSPQVDVDIQDLYDACREAEATEQGIAYDTIVSGSGKESLGGDVAVGITVQLLGDGTLRFWEGNYIAKVAGGNLVGGPGGDPIAYTAGVQTLLIQSAASTIVSTGEGVSSADRLIIEAARDQATLAAASAAEAESEAALARTGAEAARDEAKLARQHLANRAVISEDDLEVTVYADDAVTILAEFDISADKRTRTPK